ncbi:hypothetical protein BGZ57DRAFT_1009920 [Hyaloscypha finlandica]|nr:hypothetical protein BGZ57DRAFT_1009920 [Hyaloscypha finlandica]
MPTLVSAGDLLSLIALELMTVMGRRGRRGEREKGARDRREMKNRWKIIVDKAVDFATTGLQRTSTLNGVGYSPADIADAGIAKYDRLYYRVVLGIVTCWKAVHLDKNFSRHVLSSRIVSEIARQAGLEGVGGISGIGPFPEKTPRIR